MESRHVALPHLTGIKQCLGRLPAQVHPLDRLPKTVHRVGFLTRLAFHGNSPMLMGSMLQPNECQRALVNGQAFVSE